MKNDNKVVGSAVLSDMDKIFIPKDLDNSVSVEDLANYQSVGIRIFKSVPKNYCLVTKNKFTQNVKLVEGNKFRNKVIRIINKIAGNKLLKEKTSKEFGLKILTPFVTERILIPKIDATKNYDKLHGHTKDGFEVNVDIGLVMKIIDPVKYVTDGKNQLRQLDVIIETLLKDYIYSKETKDLKIDRCNLGDFDPYDELRLFENKYGVKIDKVLFKNIEFSEDYIRSADEVKQAEVRRQVAEKNAETARIEAQAEAASLKAFTEELENQGVSRQMINELLKFKVLGDNPNSVVISGASDKSNDAIGNVVAGVKAAGVRKSANMANVDRLIKRLMNINILLGYSDEIISKVSNNLKNKADFINKLSQEDYLTFEDDVCKIFIENVDKIISSSQIQGGRRK